ncbi:hypothetical protein F0562_028968 [Nyssa sinensis]|uniref:Amine oxidase domain-containing protein n=1 Tax=Nyssa sinensis TaxID=561372 RepID=A0A5J5B1R6_9ASTE|nr:hypothetical protein F0562_028968 [Nyssa sinensis]
MTLTLSLPFSNPSLLSSHTHHRVRFKPPRASAQISVDSPPSEPSPSQLKKTGVIVVGAGLAGLAAATRLHSENVPFLLLEASDAVGGRVRTDVVDGFVLDRGFQIFITAYPEAQRLLDYEALELQKFYSGAQIYYNGRFHTVADPLRHFWDSLQSLTNPIGTAVDKLLIALARIRVLTKSDDEILSGNEVSTIDLLRKIGFSDSIVDRFFRPFFGGIFFDRELETTSRLFDFVFKCLALGDNTLPAKGISAIPEQLASKLPSGSILLNSRVTSIEFESNTATVKLENGELLRSELGVILAVEQPEAVNLLEGKWKSEPESYSLPWYCSIYSFMAALIDVQIPIPNNDIEQNRCQDHEEKDFDYSQRAQWLRAAVLGANDGLVSIASLMMGVGAVKKDAKAMILIGFAGLFAGACSMAIGEFVSVYSQLDIEVAKKKREKRLRESGENEEDNEKEQLPNPVQAAMASALAFSFGAIVPLLAAAFIGDHKVRLGVVVAAVSLALVVFGGGGAVLGRTPVVKSCARVLVGGWMAMAITFGLTKLIGSSGLQM